jgi:hypothetical protein
MRKARREVFPGLHTQPKFPPLPCHKAVVELQRFHQGVHNYTRLREKGTGYLKINIGLFWRLLSRDRGRTWELMSHERYNGEIRKT